LAEKDANLLKITHEFLHFINQDTPAGSCTLLWTSAKSYPQPNLGHHTQIENSPQSSTADPQSCAQIDKNHYRSQDHDKIIGMIILASQSETRRKMLTAAGVEFTSVSSPVDEATLHSNLKHLSPRDLAIALASAKAAAHTPQNAQDLVIGADQVFALDQLVFHKPKSVEEAQQHLLKLNGQTHDLHTAYAIFRNGQNIAQHCETATLTMRNLSAAFIESYIASTPADVLTSIGCYQLEGRGIQLMQDIKGDYFTILGLSLLPLLGHLRQLGEIPS
jgi:septum formation protein